ncbi:cupin domain-containing protein [Inquilinus sp. YAF38]|uniref:cupin domain-containing protein n=1 Tax=Inquilinus sp. YAF38 TaxID=3233084 RepID=UPI003F93F047
MDTSPASSAGHFAHLRAANLIPLWEVASSLVPTEPRPSCAPCLWEYEKVIRPAMLDAGTISAEEAERRVLLLANPSLPRPATTSTLGAGFQLIIGGEVADSHRHTQAALRVVIEGQGAYTAVNGECLTMERGDLILTPSWAWHDHEKTSDGPMIWLDGLDVPLLNQLHVTFYEDLHGRQFPQSRPAGFSEATFGRGVTPVDARFGSHAATSGSAPQLRYPYGNARTALSMMESAAGPDPTDGYKLRYSNTMTGGHVLPTIGAFLQLLPAGFASRPKRQTDAEIFVVLEGSGTTIVGGQELHWRENDVFVVPNWTWRHHVSERDSVLFSFSDCAMQQALGIWRDETSG